MMPEEAAPGVDASRGVRGPRHATPLEDITHRRAHASPLSSVTHPSCWCGKKIDCERLLSRLQIALSSSKSCQGKSNTYVTDHGSPADLVNAVDAIH